MNIILIYFAIKYKGDWDKIYKALSSKEKVSIEDTIKLEEKILKEGWKIITVLDANYPARLKESYKPPFVIWVKGDEEVLKSNFICLTGNYETVQTKEWCKEFVSEALKSHTLVTCNCSTIDKVICKMSDQPILYILANGIDVEAENLLVKKKDLVITEYPYEAHASKETYRQRNRLVAAFGKALVLFSSIKGGGINHLVSNYLNLGKDIYCFPGDGSAEDGNSELIKQGANLITSIKDLSN